MDRSRRLLVVCAMGFSVLVAAGPVSTQEGSSVSTLLVLPESLQPISLERFLTESPPLSVPGHLTWFQELSPLELALLPEGSWIDPRSTISWPWLEETSDPGEGWRPLSEGETLQRKAELRSKALQYGAELADSLRAPYVSEGIRWTGEALSSYDTLAKRYRLHVNLSDDQAALQYDYTY